MKFQTPIDDLIRNLLNLPSESPIPLGFELRARYDELRKIKSELNAEETKVILKDVADLISLSYEPKKNKFLKHKTKIDQISKQIGPISFALMLVHTREKNLPELRRIVNSTIEKEIRSELFKLEKMAEINKVVQSLTQSEEPVILGFTSTPGINGDKAAMVAPIVAYMKLRVPIEAHEIFKSSDHYYNSLRGRLSYKNIVKARAIFYIDWNRQLLTTIPPPKRVEKNFWYWLGEVSNAVLLAIDIVSVAGLLRRAAVKGLQTLARNKVVSITGKSINQIDQRLMGEIAAKNLGAYKQASLPGIGKAAGKKKNAPVMLHKSEEVSKITPDYSSTITSQNKEKMSASKKIRQQSRGTSDRFGSKKQLHVPKISDPKRLLPGDHRPPRVVANELDDEIIDGHILSELDQAKRFSKISGGRIIGQARMNQRAVDGSLRHHTGNLESLQFKRLQPGGSISKILTRAFEAETKAIKYNYHNVKLVIHAKSFSKKQISEFASGGTQKLLKLPLRGRISSIYIEAKDGWMVIPGR